MKRKTISDSTFVVPSKYQKTTEATPSLPNELWIHIMGFLKIQDFLKVSETNKRLNLLSKDDLLWRSIVGASYFGNTLDLKDYQSISDYFGALHHRFKCIKIVYENIASEAFELKLNIKNVEKMFGNVPDVSTVSNIRLSSSKYVGEPKHIITYDITVRFLSLSADVIRVGNSIDVFEPLEIFNMTKEKRMKRDYLKVFDVMVVDQPIPLDQFVFLLS
jgi:hypothetical protein